MAEASERPRLSVVIACAPSAPGTLERAVRAAMREVEDAKGELLLVIPPSCDLDLTRHPAARGVPSTEPLVPGLWGDGLRASSGEAVAFLIPECAVQPGWARALLDAIAGGASGAGGCFVLHEEAGVVDAAVAMLRYAPYLGTRPASAQVPDIAGDNACYARSALSSSSAMRGGAFWEVDLHRAIHAGGGTLVLVGSATAAFAGTPGLLTMVGQRFTHGRHYGAWRRARGRSVVVAVAAAPLVPALLLIRALRRLGTRVAVDLRFALALPALITLAAAWAAGEAIGAVAGGEGTVAR